MSTLVDELKELMLREPRLSLAVAESLTGGNVQARVVTVSGASNFFFGGITAYTIDQKVRLLDVDRDHAVEVNCVSARVAEEMARGVCRKFASDVGVATTGYAEPALAEGVAEPFAWWAIVRRGERGKYVVRRGRVECPGAKRIEAQQMVAAAVLGELVAWLRATRG